MVQSPDLTTMARPKVIMTSRRSIVAGPQRMQSRSARTDLGSMLIMWRPFGQRVAGWFGVCKIVQTSFETGECRTPRQQFTLLTEYDLIECVKILLQLHTTDFEFRNPLGKYFRFVHVQWSLCVDGWM